MGEVSSSENSLNQHIKNKHAELWETIKAKHEQAMEDALKQEANGENKPETEPTLAKKLSFDEIPISFKPEE